MTTYIFHRQIQHDLGGRGQTAATIEPAETVHVILWCCMEYSTRLGNLAAMPNNQQPILPVARWENARPLYQQIKVTRYAPNDY